MWLTLERYLTYSLTTSNLSALQVDVGGALDVEPSPAGLEGLRTCQGFLRRDSGGVRAPLRRRLRRQQGQ